MNEVPQDQRTLRHQAIQRYLRTRESLRLHQKQAILRSVGIAVALVAILSAIAIGTSRLP